MACSLVLSGAATTNTTTTKNTVCNKHHGTGLIRGSVRIQKKFYPNSCVRIHATFFSDPERKNGDEMGTEKKKNRTDWLQRVSEVATHYQRKKKRQNGGDGNKEEGHRGRNRDSEGEEEREVAVKGECSSSFLSPLCRGQIKLFAQMAFLSNLAYDIPEIIKALDLRRYFDLELVTTSFDKKAEAIAKFDEHHSSKPRVYNSEMAAYLATSTVKQVNVTGEKTKHEAARTVQSLTSCAKDLLSLRFKPQQEQEKSTYIAYEIAASAASSIHSSAKARLSVRSKPQQEGDDALLQEEEEEEEKVEESSFPRVYNSDVPEHVAASTLTTVLVEHEEEKKKGAQTLSLLRSSPSGWFVCDDSRIRVRIFVIQGMDLRSSRHANLIFEPTRFEGTNVLVHRGIYEAAKGIYEQFVPIVMEHVKTYGEQAKLQFTGHSLGGSVSLLVSLMLLTRNVVNPSALLPVVTFGSPLVFCDGQNNILEELGLDENHVHCVIMHKEVLNKNKLWFSPMGKVFILQHRQISLSPEIALYALESSNGSSERFPLTDYDYDGRIPGEQDSRNYLKALNGILRQNPKAGCPPKRIRHEMLRPVLTLQSQHE